MRSRSAAALAAAAFLAACSGHAVTAPVVPPAPAMDVAPGAPALHTYIKHVVVIVQENRSFEQVFAGWPGADAPMFGMTSKGQRVALTSRRLEDSQDLGHRFEDAETEWDNGKMDRFDLDRFGAAGNGSPAGLFPYSYLDRTEIAPYRALARDYVLGDRFFATEFGGSFTAHQDLIAGQTRIDADHSLVDWPSTVPWGCDAPTGTITLLVDQQRKITANGPFPCFDQYETIADSLDARGVSWKYYTQALYTFGGEVWNAFDSNRRVRYGKDWSRNIIVPDTEALTDPGKGALASVTFVIPDGQWSDHPAAPTDYGPSWVGNVVNAIGRSKYWKDTAIVVMWDDWGGYYDNVPPPQVDSVGLGMRLPVIVVSPYARRGYVSHTRWEYGSILKFIEQAFDLPSIHSTDVRANSLIDAFDFTQKPRPFVRIHTKYPPSFYLNFKQPRPERVDD
jgi:phospholipase C